MTASDAVPLFKLLVIQEIASDEWQKFQKSMEDFARSHGYH